MVQHVRSCGTIELTKKQTLIDTVQKQHSRKKHQKRVQIVQWNQKQLPLIVDFPIKHGGSFHSYVNVYQAGYSTSAASSKAINLAVVSALTTMLSTIKSMVTPSHAFSGADRWNHRQSGPNLQKVLGMLIDSLRLFFNTPWKPCLVLKS